MSLLGVDAARIDSVYVTQSHEPGRVTLHFQTDIELLGAERLYRLGGQADGGSAEEYRTEKKTRAGGKGAEGCGQACAGRHGGLYHP